MTEDKAKYNVEDSRLDTVEAAEQEIESTKPTGRPSNEPPRYAVVLRFWNTPQELEVVDIVSCRNRFTQENYVKFIDTDGRLWDNVPQDDVILITNYPGKEDMEDFMRLKRETVELNKLIASKKPDMDDVSIR